LHKIQLTDTEGLGPLLKERVGLLLGGLLGAVWRLACSHALQVIKLEEKLTRGGGRPGLSFSCLGLQIIESAQAPIILRM
jgi:hypothetical protein